LADGAVVLAAGGAVFRRNQNDTGYEVVLVHRPRYDDWSWPKGKCEPGESLDACAVREVSEETGVLTTIGPILCVLNYRDQLNRPKRVTYFVLKIASIREHQADEEVDAIAWIGLDDVNQWLTTSADTTVTHALSDYLERQPH
jgi:8-oxo-dGTP diphosphatase